MIVERGMNMMEVITKIFIILYGIATGVYPIYLFCSSEKKDMKDLSVFSTVTTAMLIIFYEMIKYF